MRLYTFRYAPHPLKIRWALAELGIEYEAMETNIFRGDQKQDEFLTINQSGKIPFLEHGSLRLRESNAILTYIGRNFGKHLWPRRAEKDADAMQWLFYETAELAPNCVKIWWGEAVAPVLGRKVDEAELTKAAADLKPALSVMETRLGRRQFCLDDEFSLVDCSVGVTLMLLRDTRIEESGLYPNVFEYLARLRRRRTWLEIEGDLLQQISSEGTSELGISPSGSETISQ